MLQQNEGPRIDQDERDNERREEYRSKGSFENSRNDKGLSEEGNTDKENVSARTPERWWLRKRLMQG